MNGNNFESLKNNKEQVRCSCGYNNVTGATKCSNCGKGILVSV